MHTLTAEGRAALDDAVTAAALANRSMNCDTRHPGHHAVSNGVVLKLVDAVTRVAANVDVHPVPVGPTGVQQQAATDLVKRAGTSRRRPQRPDLPDGMRWTWVTLGLNDNDGTYHAAVYEGHGWNGFVVPFFPADQIDLIIADCRQAMRVGGTDALPAYPRRAADNPYVVEEVHTLLNEDGNDRRPGEEPLIELCHATELGLFCLFGASWGWQVAQFRPMVSLFKQHAGDDVRRIGTVWGDGGPPAHTFDPLDGNARRYCQVCGQMDTPGSHLQPAPTTHQLTWISAGNADLDFQEATSWIGEEHQGLFWQIGPDVMGPDAEGRCGWYSILVDPDQNNENYDDIALNLGVFASEQDAKDAAQRFENDRTS